MSKISKLNVLITGGGSPGIAGTIYSLRNNPDNRKIKIITVDARDDVVGKYLSDSFYIIPKYNENRFIDELFNICKKEKIDVILPQVTKELDVLSQNKDNFESNGIKIIVSNKESLSKANNKYYIMKEFDDLGYDQGFFSLIKTKKDLMNFAKKCGYPDNMFVVKMPVSNGMRGLRIVRDKKLTLKEFINDKPSGEYATLDEIESLFEQNNNSLFLSAMEYCSGDEYSVDVYRSPLTKKTIAIPRIRSVIRTGITFEGEIVRNELMIEASEKLANSLDLNYCFGFQFKFNDKNEIRILESNPRIQGTMIMSVLAGANMIYWSVKEAMEEKVELDNVDIQWGMKFKRYWGGLTIGKGQIQKIC